MWEKVKETLPNDNSTEELKHYFFSMFKDMVSHISEHKFKSEAQTGDIILCNTGRIQGIDTVSSKKYVFGIKSGQWKSFYGNGKKD